MEIQLSASGGGETGVQWSVWQHRQPKNGQQQQQQQQEQRELQQPVQVASGSGALGDAMYLAAVEAALQQDGSPTRSQRPTVLKVSGKDRL
jgi:hypothetical protein